MMRGQQVAGGPQASYIAPGANRQGLVLGLGLSLVAFQLWNDSGWRNVFNALIGLPLDTSKGPPGTIGGVDLLLQVGMVLLATFIAGFGDEAGTIALILIGGLWLVWLVTHSNMLSKSLATLAG